MTTIRCHCGEIEVELAGEPIAQFYCHCEDCQAVHGAAYVPAAMYRREDVMIARGTPRRWTYKHTPRAACPSCATRLFAEPPHAPVTGVMALLLPPGLFKPAFHIYCREALLPIHDDLPHYATVPPQFGGSDERASW
jgi:hypothetical protein